jgi:hypothetical protein
MPIKANTRNPSFLDRGRFYSLRQFITDSGISSDRIRRARQAGIVLPLVIVGKRVFVRGDDGIAFIEALAAHHAVQQEQQESPP